MRYNNWEEKMQAKKWEEMQKYKEFNKDNFKGVERFSRVFNKIFNFFRFSFLAICVIAIIIGLLIYLGFVFNLKNQISNIPKPISIAEEGVLK